MRDALLPTDAVMGAEVRPAQAASTWARWLCPSISDLVFLLVIFWSFMAGGIGWQRLLLDADTGLHTRIGDYVLAHHAVPTHDMFAFSRPGQEWFAFEWGTETLFGFLHGQFGMKGLVLVIGLAIGACFAVLFRYALWRGANALISLALILIAVNGSSFNFHARPHVFTLLLLAGAVWLVERDRRERTRLVWLLVPLTALWANLHGGFLMFLALAGLLAIGCVIERRWSDAFRYGTLAAACGAASLANPYGIRLHLHIFETMQSEWIMNTVGEFKSPVFRSEWMTDFMLLLFLGLACLVPLLQKRKFTESLWILFLAYESLHSVRHAPIFMLIAVPIVACELTGWWKSWVEGRDRKSVARILEDLSVTVAIKSRASSIWIPVAVIALAFTSAIDWPTGFSDEEFPIHIIDHHAAQIASARIFTTDQWADYLIYRNYPTQRVFMDSRHNYYGPKIGDDYMALLETSLTTREVAKYLKVDVSRVRQRLRERSLFGIEYEGEHRLPRFQFERRHVLPGLKAIIGALPVMLNPLDVAQWFLAPNPDLELADEDDPMSPRDWLLRGEPVSVVVALARGFE